jgi:hypothetical protein
MYNMSFKEFQNINIVEDVNSVFSKILNSEAYKLLLKEIEDLIDNESKGDSQDYEYICRSTISKLSNKLKNDFHI